jgi:hypothetical protein
MFQTFDIAAIRAICPSLLCSFEARKLRAASVVWLNARWFAQTGLNVLHPEQRERANTWLLEEFAFAVPRAHDDPDSFTTQTKTFSADRYGGLGTGHNGGSGRVGIRGAFQVKGIGPTPLVSPKSDATHSHGAQTLEEAIREAVYAEIFGRELPNGAVPIIAVILTGTRMPWNERCALSIRPNFVRPSHCERATFFRPRDDAALDHLKDVVRVRQVISAIAGGRNSRTTLRVRANCLLEFISNVAQTLAYCHANRLYFGPCSTSNISFDGEPFDFGSARALPDWRACISVKGDMAFGLDDLDYFDKSISDLVHFFGRYAQADSPFLAMAEQHSTHLRVAYEYFLRKELGALANLTSETCSATCFTAVSQSLFEYFRSQQDLRYDVLANAEGKKAAWLGSLIGSLPDDLPSSPLKEVIQRIEHALRDEFGTGRTGTARQESSMKALQRALLPRRLLARERLSKDIYEEVVERRGDGGTPEEIRENAGTLIEEVISASRRTFRHVPLRRQVLAAASDGSSDAALHKDPLTGARAVTLSGVTCGRKRIFFGNALRQNRSATTECAVTISVPDGYEGEASRLMHGGQFVDVPSLNIRFDHRKELTNESR